jgi:hypothetical protein
MTTDNGQIESALRSAGEPLTDPRSLASSVLFHVSVVLVAALVPVLNGSIPLAGPGSKAIYAEVDPVDNRAERFPNKPGQGGGSPGEIGGTSNLPSVPADLGTSPPKVTRDPVAETLLAEILPSSLPKPQESRQHGLPGPRTPGQGIIPGSGTGGGGGAGGGSGGGVGRGIGPGTQFFGAREHAHSFAYVIDCSGSMAMRNSLDVAKRELLASLSQLPPDAEFAVIFYNSLPYLLSDGEGHKGLMTATESHKSQVRTQLAAIAPDGGTDHMAALRKALELKPEVVFFLTDADLMNENAVTKILGQVGSTRIQAVEFGLGTEVGQRPPLARLATSTGGTYLYIDVSRFPRSSGGY